VTTYFDASALAKLVLAEPGWHEARSLWDSSEIVASSWIALPEVRSALERARRGGRIGRKRLQRAIAEFEDGWARMVAVVVDLTVGTRAAALTSKHALRGQDAIHLASALRLDDDELVLATWDRRLKEAALAEGVAVAPA
jgi:predicted nucleic acid-binding protein